MTLTVETKEEKMGRKENMDLLLVPKRLVTKKY